MNNKQLELEAEKYAKMVHENPVMKAFREYTKQDFIAGATSYAAKQYWYKQFEKQKLEFAIEQLKSLEPTDYDVDYSSPDLRYFRNELRKRRIELEQKLKEL